MRPLVSQRAYSLGSCAMGQTDGRIAPFQHFPRAGARVVPPLGASVLEPHLDLCVGDVEAGGDGRALGGRQVLLSAERVLELRQLRARERRARLLARGQQQQRRRWSGANGRVELVVLMMTSSCTRPMKSRCRTFSTYWTQHTAPPLDHHRTSGQRTLTRGRIAGEIFHWEILM